MKDPWETIGQTYPYLTPPGQDQPVTDPVLRAFQAGYNLPSPKAQRGETSTGAEPTKKYKYKGEFWDPRGWWYPQTPDYFPVSEKATMEKPASSRIPREFVPEEWQRMAEEFEESLRPVREFPPEDAWRYLPWNWNWDWGWPPRLDIGIPPKPPMTPETVGDLMYREEPQPVPLWPPTIENVKNWVGFFKQRLLEKYGTLIPPYEREAPLR